MYYAEQQVAASTVFFSVPIRLTGNATITSYGATLEGAAGHGGEVGTRPRLELLLVGYDGSVTSLDTTTDGALVATNYEDEHTFWSSSISAPLTGTGTYMMRLRGEYGTNSMTGLRCYSIAVNYNVTAWSRI